MSKKYIVQEDSTELGVVKGDLFYETEDNYYCYKYDEEVSDGGVYTTYSYKHFPKELVEGNDLFLLANKEVATHSKPEIEKEASIEEVKKELQDDVVQEPLVKRIKVVLNFPGGKEGEIFEYSNKSNAYIRQTPIDEDEYLYCLARGGYREPYFGMLTVEEVLSNIDYFEDITPKVVKTKEEVMMKIADLAEQKLGIEKSIVDATNKLYINTSKRQLKILKSVIEALEWSIGEGRDFIVE